MGEECPFLKAFLWSYCDCTLIPDFSLQVSHRNQSADITLEGVTGSLICIEKDVVTSPPSPVLSVGSAELIPHKSEFPLL